MMALGHVILRLMVMFMQICIAWNLHLELVRRIDWLIVKT